VPEYIANTEGIKKTFTREEFPAKTLLVKEGALAKKLFYIDKGCCRTWFNNDGKEVTYQFQFEGTFASSFETIISNQVSWYSVETLEPTITYSIGIDEFKKMMELYPQVRSIYYQYIEKRLVLYQKLFVSHIKDSPEKRYRELLLHHPEIIRRVPQHYIASFLGITSVSLSRIRNRK
jgi:CRP-like cAMP-binding protein